MVLHTDSRQPVPQSSAHAPSSSTGTSATSFHPIFNSPVRSHLHKQPPRSFSSDELIDFRTRLTRHKVVVATSTSGGTSSSSVITPATRSPWGKPSKLNGGADHILFQSPPYFAPNASRSDAEDLNGPQRRRYSYPGDSWTLPARERNPYAHIIPFTPLKTPSSLSKRRDGKTEHPDTEPQAPEVPLSLQFASMVLYHPDAVRTALRNRRILHHLQQLISSVLSTADSTNEREARPGGAPLPSSSEQSLVNRSLIDSFLSPTPGEKKPITTERLNSPRPTIFGSTFESQQQLSATFALAPNGPPLSVSDPRVTPGMVMAGAQVPVMGGCLGCVQMNQDQQQHMTLMMSAGGGGQGKNVRRCPVHCCPFCERMKDPMARSCGQPHQCSFVDAQMQRCGRLVLGNEMPIGLLQLKQGGVAGNTITGGTVTSATAGGGIFDLCPHHWCPHCGGEKSAMAQLCPNCTSTHLLFGRMRRPSYIVAPQTFKDDTFRWLFVFDFDHTITTAHTTGAVPIEQASEFTILQNLRAKDFFRAVVMEILARGQFVAIVTYADAVLPVPGMIQGRLLVSRYMDVIFGPERQFLHCDDFEAFLPPNHGMTMNHGKDIHIRNLLRQLNALRIVVPNSHVVLFDDSSSNCVAARMAGYQAYECPEGFNPPIWNTFVRENQFG